MQALNDDRKWSVQDTKLYHCLYCWDWSHKFILTGFGSIDRCPSFQCRFGGSGFLPFLLSVAVVWSFRFSEVASR